MLEVRVVPGASREEIVGWVGAAVKAKVRAPALDGRANAAVCALLAGALRVPVRDVTLLRGEKSRQKTLRIAGLDRAAVLQRLGLGPG